MSRSGIWIKGGLAAALVAAIPLLPRAAPRRLAPHPAPPAQAFAPVCKDNPAEDSRPDPAWVLAGYDGDNCRAPVMPVPPDGRTATREQIVAGMTAVKTYAGRAQAFEKCIGDAVASRKAQPVTGKSFLLVETHRISVSEKNRKIAASRMAAAIDAFNAFGSECAEE